MAMDEEAEAEPSDLALRNRMPADTWVRTHARTQRRARATSLPMGEDLKRKLRAVVGRFVAGGRVGVSGSRSSQREA